MSVKGYLPSVLIPQPPLTSISMERALKQILSILKDIDPTTNQAYDKIEASIDDLEVMLGCIDRT
jgi:hypothetical protein